MPNENPEDVQPTKKAPRMNRRGILKGGLLGVLASAFSLVPFSQADAASQSNSNWPEKIDVTPISGVEAKKYTRLVAESQDYQRFKGILEQENVVTFVPQEHETAVIAISIDKQTFASVRIPIVGGAGNGFYTASFARGNSTILSTMSALFTEDANHNIHAVAKRNGEAAFDGIIAPDGEILHGTFYTLNGPQTLENVNIPESISGFFSCLLSCLAGLGVASWLIGLLGAICSVACVLFAPVCLACVIDVLGGLGAEVGWCAGVCSV